MSAPLKPGPARQKGRLRTLGGNSDELPGSGARPFIKVRKVLAFLHSSSRGVSARLEEPWGLLGQDSSLGASVLAAAFRAPIPTTRGG